MPIRNILPHNIPGESNDVVKVFVNIDKEDFEFTWENIGNHVKYTVKAGETINYPKYLVNFASYHLAKKIVKREMIEEFKLKNPNINWETKGFSIRNEDREVAYQKKMLEKNFNAISEDKIEPPIEPKQEPTRTLNESPPDKPEPKVEEGIKCPLCEFRAKNTKGLKTHLGAKH